MINEGYIDCAEDSTDYWRCDGCKNIVVSGTNSCHLDRCEKDGGKPYTGLFDWRHYMYGTPMPNHTKEEAEIND